MKKKHPLDWYADNTPSDDKEYERGCLFAFVVFAIILFALTIIILLYD